MDEKKVVKSKPHNINIEGREKLQISGVVEVGSFNDNTISLDTELGGLIIKGVNLHISKLNVDDGNLMIEGYMVSCIYSDKMESSKDGSFLSRIFK